MNLRGSKTLCLILASRPFMDSHIQNGTFSLGDYPLIPRKEGGIIMLELIYLGVGILIGSIWGIVYMCIVQINRLTEERKDEIDNETKY